MEHNRNHAPAAIAAADVFAAVVACAISVAAAQPTSAPTAAPTAADDDDDGSGVGCFNTSTPGYLDCCDEYGVSMKPYWLLVLQAPMLVLLTDVTPMLVGRLRARLRGQRSDPGDETYSAPRPLFAMAVIFSQAVLAIYGGYALVIGRTHGHDEPFKLYSETVLLLMNSGVGGALFGFVTRGLIAGYVVGEAADKAHVHVGDVATVAWAAVALVYFSLGYPIAATLTHILPGTLAFSPILACVVLAAALLYWLVVQAGALTQRRWGVDLEAWLCGPDEDAGDFSRSAVTWQIFRYSWVYGVAAAVVFVLAPTLMFQLWAGVPWVDAMANDARARGSGKFWACASRQAAELGTDGAALADLVGVVF